jgi:hypothetical protein
MLEGARSEKIDGGWAEVGQAEAGHDVGATDDEDAEVDQEEQEVGTGREGGDEGGGRGSRRAVESNRRGSPHPIKAD